MSKFIVPVFALVFAMLALGTSPAFASGNSVVPEPATWLLLGSGLAGLAAWRWYHRS